MHRKNRLQRLRCILCVLMCFSGLSLTGCGASGGPDGEPRTATMEVTGTVHVDGVPAAFLKVTAHPVGGVGAVPLDPSAVTAGDGKFALSTYESGDGIPAGEYKLSFEWGELNLMNGQYSGDKLNGRYAKPESSQVAVKVVAGDEPKDLGTIELSSKE